MAKGKFELHYLGADEIFVSEKYGSSQKVRFSDENGKEFEVKARGQELFQQVGALKRFEKLNIIVDCIDKPYPKFELIRIEK